MGIFDSIKNALGKSEAKPDFVTPPSTLLRQAGVDPAGLKFTFGSGSIAVSGSVDSESRRRQIIEILQKIDGINQVQDNLSVAAAEPSRVTGAATETPTEKGPRRYIVQSGDTLWKIAQQMYGQGSEYMKIFEANRDKLKDPDRIFPGQELVIPD